MIRAHLHRGGGPLTDGCLAACGYRWSIAPDDPLPVSQQAPTVFCLACARARAHQAEDATTCPCGAALPAAQHRQERTS